MPAPRTKPVAILRHDLLRPEAIRFLLRNCTLSFRSKAAFHSFRVLPDSCRGTSDTPSNPYTSSLIGEFGVTPSNRYRTDRGTKYKARTGRAFLPYRSDRIRTTCLSHALTTASSSASSPPSRKSPAQPAALSRRPTPSGPTSRRTCRAPSSTSPPSPQGRSCAPDARRPACRPPAAVRARRRSDRAKRRNSCWSGFRHSC